MNKEKNIEFWLSVEKTDPSKTKAVNSGGRRITAINAQSQIKEATRQWGKYGSSWGLKDIQIDYVNNLCNDQLLAVSRAVFYYPDGSFEIGSSIMVQSWITSKAYNKVDDDFLKKLETDMTTKALSKLGFNADVFMGMYDDNKYIQKITNEFKEKPLLDPKSDAFNSAKEAISSGSYTLDQVKSKYNLSKEVELLLTHTEK